MLREGRLPTSQVIRVSHALAVDVQQYDVMFRPWARCADLPIRVRAPQPGDVLRSARAR
jgi:hypothetical protein